LIALSTAWIPEDGWPIEQVLDRLNVLHSQGVEFNYRVHPLDLARTQRELEKRGLTVTSLHNICSTNHTPVPHTDRYGDSIAALDEAVRQAAVMSLIATAETARALGASAIVVHSGAVESLKDADVYLQTMKQATRANMPEILQRELPALLEERQRVAPQQLAQLVKSLNEVCPQFPDIRFGLETRYHFHGFPDFDELDLVLAQMDGDNVGYWHDCGHGQVQEHLGIRRHEDWLRRYQGRLIGIHLHGMSNQLLDHEAPAPDNMDFLMVRRYTNADTLLTIEAHAGNSVKAMQAGIAYLESIFLA